MYALGMLSQHNAQTALDEIPRDDSPAYRQAGLPLALDALGRRVEADRELATQRASGVVWLSRLVIYAA